MQKRVCSETEVTNANCRFEPANSRLQLSALPVELWQLSGWPPSITTATCSHQPPDTGGCRCGWWSSKKPSPRAFGVWCSGVAWTRLLSRCICCSIWRTSRPGWRGGCCDPRPRSCLSSLSLLVVLCPTYTWVELSSFKSLCVSHCRSSHVKAAFLVMY